MLGGSQPCAIRYGEIFFFQMKTCTYILLSLLLMFPGYVGAQTKPEPPSTNETTSEQPGSTTGTYSDTLRMLKAWLDTEESHEMARPVFRRQCQSF